MGIKDSLKSAICNNDIEYFEQRRGTFFIDERFEDDNNDTLLLYSISDRESEMYKYLLDNGADPHLTNDEEEGIFHAIVFSGDIERLKYIIEKYTLNINHKANDGATPLLLSISLNKKDIALLLVNYGADVNLADNDGITPLHLAAQSNNIELVESLLNKKVDAFAKTINGNLALALAVNSGNLEIIKLLFHKMYDDFL